MKRALTLGLVLIATAASSADIALATRHDELRALDVAPSRVAPSRKVQWAPSGNFQALHARSVFRGETGSAARPYGRENFKTAAGAGIFLSRDSAPGDVTSPMSLQRYLYAHGNPLRYTDPTGRCIFQSCSELWTEMTTPEAPASPPPATPVKPSLPTYDWGSVQAKKAEGADRRMRERFDDYLYRQEPPASGDAADILEWRQQRANARGTVEAMATVENVARGYLKHVAAPYLIAEGGGLGVVKVGGAVTKAVLSDLAAETAAAKQLSRIERFEAAAGAQKTAPTLPLRDAEFGDLEATASANRPAEAGAGLEGKAVIRRYTNADGSAHFSVEVQPSIGTRIETHQTRSASFKSTYVNEVDDLIRERLGHAEVREVPLQNAFKSQEKQLEQLGAGDMGPFKPRGPNANSCTTGICEVIRAGGGDAPASAADAQQHLYDLFGKSTKGAPE